MTNRITFPILAFILLCFVSVKVLADHGEKHKEAYYQQIVCDIHDADVEVRNEDNTRTDCLSVEESIEVDFAPKWYECLGQAMHYARLNRNKAVCMLVVMNRKDESRVVSAKMLIDHFHLPVEVQQIWGGV
ncbi:hypothetical protein N9937_00895 [bacterium]|nr:hypothetical protein [bacterium]